MIVPEMGYTTPKWLNKNGTCNDDNPTDLWLHYSQTKPYLSFSKIYDLYTYIYIYDISIT